MSIRTRPKGNSWAPRLEVTSWPFDELARERLTEFRHERKRDLNVVFCGDDLDLRGAHLCGFDFRRSWFSGCVLDQASLLGSNFTDASLSRASLLQADLTACVLIEADLSYCAGSRSTLAWARLMRAEAYSADLREADLLGVELDQAVLRDADLRGARLREARFSRTSLGGARLAGAILDGARGSVLGPVDISKTDEPELVDGDELSAWLREQGANHLMVTRP